VAAQAQAVGSAISGVVQDESGAILPGVTVEAASPALIEKTRTANTDGQGQYRIVDLRPGLYVVTFSLSGFGTVRREGLNLPAGFTATVNVELKVGELSETVTVTGASPVVDTESVRQQTGFEREVIDVLPTGTRTEKSIFMLTPGVTFHSPTFQDVGGSQGERSAYPTAHGSRIQDNQLMWDGMNLNSTEGSNSGRGILLNMGSTQEIILQTGGFSAESAQSGVIMNVVPKEGSNRWTGDLIANYTNGDLQSDNLTDGLRARGMTLVNSVNEIWDSNISFGGPLRQDKLWVLAAARSWGREVTVAGLYFNKTQGTPIYTPDFDRPAIANEHNRSFNARLTWQATPRNKFNIFGEDQDDCSCRYAVGGALPNAAPEAAGSFRFKPAGVYQATWSSPVSSRLLLEAGATAHPLQWPGFQTPEVKPTDIAIVELRTNFRYNASGGLGSLGVGDRINWQGSSRFAASYVSGSHTFKTGFQFKHSYKHHIIRVNEDIEYRFLDGLPNSVILWATPFEARERGNEYGWFVQDQWAMRNITLHLGARLDHLTGWAPAQTLQPTRYQPDRREFDSLENVPNFWDVTPRLGLAWDLSGDGKTAIKADVGRYVGAVGLSLATQANPTRNIVTNTTRTWNDANSDFVPQESELGPYSASTFGQPRVTQRLSPEVTEGFGTRASNWTASIELQRELLPRLSVQAGYYRRWYEGFTVVDNLAVTPSDFSGYSITAPLNPTLPGGGGYPIGGLYDVTPTKFGAIDNVVVPAATFGEQQELSDFINLTFRARLVGGAALGGGYDAGRRVNDACLVVDSPQQQFCRVVTPVSATRQLKIYGSYPLPIGGVVLSGTFQSLAGIPISATYVAGNGEIAPSLGRNLAACGAQVSCTAIASVQLIEPQTMFEDGINQLDLRLTKRFSLGGYRLDINVDAYNALNASPILDVNTAYGPQWLQPRQILDGRLFKFGFNLVF
jgi:hypothetical protein